ncbi:unnamed protein product [Effrenium voratum]|nr:unnamed protein product [Effrenium voratum]
MAASTGREQREGELNSARSNPLFDAARARKQAEQDSILLANRIRLLRNEEAKTKRKIAETERKTQEIVQSRRRNELRRQEKEAFEAQKEAMESEFRAKQILEREDQQHKIQDQMRRIQEKNRSGGRVQRQQRQAHRQILDLEKQAAADEAFARAEQVRAAMDRAARSRARSEGAKQELAKDVIRERMVREEDERRQRVSEIERMEREEAELMERLRRSQERHRMAYMQLEDVLRQGSVQSLSMSPSEFQMANVFEAPALQQEPEPEVQSVQSVQSMSRPSVSSRASTRSNRREEPCGYKPPLPRAPPGARPSSASRKAVARMVGAAPPMDAVDRLRQKHSSSAMSTASVEDSSTGVCEGSGQSTPSSAAAPQIRYTTVDGLQLDIPAEEDLDLAALLNGR